MKSPAWLLVVMNLPGRNQTLRMRVWRGLKASGAPALRDGVYLLPNTPASRQVFEEFGGEVRSGGGSARLLAFDAESPTEHQSFVALFDRTAAYTDVKKRIDSIRWSASKLKEPEARRRLAALRRDVADVISTDFFPGDGRAQAQQTLATAEAALNARFSPDEPTAVHRRIVRRDRKDYQRRLWATRKGLWIDRVCSAWLIRRFIDPKATFVWLKSIKDCPKRAFGFDFDGATFTHVDSKVTFEVLLISFGLEHHVGLARLAEIVRYLDIGGLPVAEAAGFVAIMTGARASHTSDDEFMKAVFPVLDQLYAGFGVAE
jgi:hypothetical protein